MEITQNLLETQNIQAEEEDGLEKFSNMMSSTHQSVQMEGLAEIQRTLSQENHNVTLQRAISLGIVPKLLEFLTWEHDSQCLLHSTQCVISMCREEQFSDYIIQLGGIESLISLLDSCFIHIVHQAICAIGNIAYCSATSRNLCLEKGCLSKMFQVLEKFASLPNMRKGAFLTIYRLIRGDPRPEWTRIAPALPVLHKEISEGYSPQTLSYALWSLSKISGWKAKEVIDQGCVPFLVQHLQNNDSDILVPALLTLKDLVSGNLSNKNKVLESAEFLPRVLQLLISSDEEVREHSLEIFRNLMAGESAHFETILKNEDFIANLKPLVSAESQEVRNLAALFISNIISQATPEFIHRFVKDHNLFEVFPHLLTSTSPETIKISLKAILSILMAGGDTSENQYTHLIHETNLVEIIKDLSSDEGYITLLILEYLYQ